MAFGASTLAVLLLGLYGPASSRWPAPAAAGRLLEREGGRRLHARQLSSASDGVVVVNKVPSTRIIFQTSTADTVTVINSAKKPTPTAGGSPLEPDYSQTPSPATSTCPQGYLGCAVNHGGGCCPTGWGCAADSCIPPATVTATRTCLPSSYLCPASAGGGCCPNGYSCGPAACRPAHDLDPITVTQAGVVIVQSYEVTATAAVPKATEEPIGVKLTPTAPTPSADIPDAQSEKPKKPFATVKTASIAGGVCAAVIIIGLAVCFAWRKVKHRGNTAWGAGNLGDRSDIVAAPTGRAFDPNAPPPLLVPPPRHSRFASGFYGGNRRTSGGRHPSVDSTTAAGIYRDDPHRLETKPGAGAYYYPSPHEKAYVPVPLDSPPPEAAHFGNELPHSPPAVELLDTSAQVAPRGVHEADGRERGRRMS